MVVLDVEGVLVPEIWIAVAERTGIDELRRTTRDEPDYDVLMRGRLDLLDRHGLGLAAIQATIGELGAAARRQGVPRRPAGAPARHPVVGHVRRVRRAADGAARPTDDPVPRPRGRRRPHRRLPLADGRSEAGRRRSVPIARLPRARQRGLLQRRVDAPRGRRRVPVPCPPRACATSSRSSRRSRPTPSSPPPSPDADRG